METVSCALLTFEIGRWQSCRNHRPAYVDQWNRPSLKLILKRPVDLAIRNGIALDHHSRSQEVPNVPGKAFVCPQSAPRSRAGPRTRHKMFAYLYFGRMPCTTLEPKHHIGLQKVK